MKRLDQCFRIDWIFQLEGSTSRSIRQLAKKSDFDHVNVLGEQKFDGSDDEHD